MGNHQLHYKEGHWCDPEWLVEDVVYYVLLAFTCNFYTAVGYLSPSLFIVALLLGFVWEFSECYTLNWSRVEGGMPSAKCADCIMACGGFADILANGLGLSLGLASYYLNQNLRK